MAAISLQVDFNALRQSLEGAEDEFVKRVWQPRREQCLMAAGDALKAHGYLPKDTTYEVTGGSTLWFSVYKGGSERDLAHYFFEGTLYGPNFPKFEEYETWTDANGKEHYVYDSNGNRVGIGDPIDFKSPKGYGTKHPLDGRPIPHQGQGEVNGVPHWTEYLAEEKDGALWSDFRRRCEDILRR